jgi:SAM-dependent methyltransferase
MKTNNLSKTTYRHNPVIHNSTAASVILPFIFDLIKPNSVLDIGCGLGTWLSVAKELGANKILGVDSPFVNDKLLQIDKADFLAHDLKLPLKLLNKFDLVLSLEVAEHIPESHAKQFVENLVLHGDIILFSAAVPFQGGQNHLNEQWPDYWSSLFKQYGFEPFDFIRFKFWNNEGIDSWYRQNIILFAKAGTHIEGYSPVENILRVYHPDLFTGILKNASYSDEFRKKVLFAPKVIFSFKTLIKAVLLSLGLKKPKHLK